MMVAIAFVLLSSATCILADEEEVGSALQLSGSLGYHYSTGKYGSSERTDISFVPLTLTARDVSWMARLTLPYINVSGLPALDGTAVGDTVVTGTGSGIGDIVLEGVYTVTPLEDWMPYLDVGARVKFPTADDERGLGTGKFDYQLNLEVARVFGNVTPFASVGYRFVGDPASFDLRNVWLASVGTVLQVASGVNAGAFLFYQQSASTTSEDQLDIMPYIDWKPTTDWSISLYTTAGLQDGSPDFGTGVQLTYSVGR